MIVSFAFIFLLSVSIVSAGFFDWITGDATIDDRQRVAIRTTSVEGDSFCEDLSTEQGCKDGGCTWSGSSCSGVNRCRLGQKLMDGVCVSTSTTGIRVAADRADSTFGAAGTSGVIASRGWAAVKAADPNIGTCYIKVKEPRRSLFSGRISAFRR